MQLNLFVVGNNYMHQNAALTNHLFNVIIKKEKNLKNIAIKTAFSVLTI